jgi:two-component system NarL family response regulator
LRQVLETAAGRFDVIGEGATGEDAIELARDLQPDVVILDVRMPHGDGISAAKAIRQLAPHARVLMLTVSDDPDDVALAAKVGASGYLLKDRSLEEVEEAVTSLAHGASWPAAVG